MSDRIGLQTRAMLLRRVVQDIADGKIGIPAFQRAFVWREGQIRDLFDSIRNGYPIGALVLWDAGKSLPVIDFLTNRPLDSLNDRKVDYVLDGRQRLTAFYGCISQIPDKDPKFRLAYNLRSDSFEYPQKQNVNDDRVVLISDIFDTFTLIGILQTLSSKYAGEPELQTWLQRAKNLNSILQEYQCVVINLSDCTLHEAEKVFSRINSKGTTIEKAEMFQAYAYAYDSNAPLLSTGIREIKSALRPYRLDNLSDSTILNCYFRFVGKNFYDISIKSDPKEIEKLCLTDHSNRVMEAVLLTSRFLREHCYLMDGKWLPYKHQFTALSHFFARHPEPDASQLAELRRWFFYTSAAQSFGNSALPILRYIFGAFNDYVDGKRPTALDYKPFIFESDFRFTVNVKSAKANFLILSLTRHYMRHCPGCHPSGFGVTKHGGKQAVNYYVTFSHDDEAFLRDILKKDNSLMPMNVSEETLARFCLSDACLQTYGKSSYKFHYHRSAAFLACHMNLWQELFPETWRDYFIPNISAM